VTDVRRAGGEFEVVMGEAAKIAARRVVLATGGMSIPKTGSDGLGYRIAQSLGHTIVPPTPALVPWIQRSRSLEASAGASSSGPKSKRISASSRSGFHRSSAGAKGWSDA